MKIGRIYPLPKKSFFLFGPRGVGKSTWIKAHYNHALEIDLLQHKNFIELQNNPDTLEQRVAHLKRGAWVFIDEIQKLPSLLDEVHRLIEKRGLHFILTGSSARKIKCQGVNLLAGRALTHKMYPFSLRELGTQSSIKTRCILGLLPIVLNNPENAEQTLYSYVETYLREEIKEEAAVRRLDQFSRFLQIAGRLSGQVINFQNIARETGRSGPAVSKWYDILEETLLAHRIEPYRPGFKVRETGHPKYYLFDPGVARVCAQIGADEFGSTEMGFSLETLILNELLVYREISGRMKPIYYYSTPGAGEIDFLIETKAKTINHPAEFITLEIKLSTKWKSEFEAPSRALFNFAKTKHKRMIGVYLGTDRLTRHGFEVYSLADFINELFEGKIF